MSDIREAWANNDMMEIYAENMKKNLITPHVTPYPITNDEDITDIYKLNYQKDQPFKSSDLLDNQTNIIQNSNIDDQQNEVSNYPIDSELYTEFDEKQSDNKNESIEKKNDKNDNYDIDYNEIFEFILNNLSLKNKLERKFNVKIIDNKTVNKQISSISKILTGENKEILMIIFIGIFILLILDLFVNIGQKLYNK